MCNHHLKQNIVSNYKTDIRIIIRHNVEYESHTMRGADFDHKQTFYCVFLDDLFFLDSYTIFTSFSFVEIHYIYVMGSTAKCWKWTEINHLNSNVSWSINPISKNKTYKFTFLLTWNIWKVYAEKFNAEYNGRRKPIWYIVGVIFD